MTYDSYRQFPLQFLIKINEIWPMTAMGHFLYNPLSTSLKYDLWKLWAISITIPYHNHWNMSYDSYGWFPRFLIKIIEIWPMAAMGNSITIPYQNHWNMTYDCYGSFPLQFLIKIIEIWPMTATCHLPCNSLSKSLKYDQWLLRAISFAIPSHTHWNMTCNS